MAATISLGMTAPAFAINPVRCNESGYTGFYQGSSPERKFCHANSGVRNVLIADINGIWPGINSGRIETNKGYFYFQRDTGPVDVPNVTVLKIIIYG
jgi:hypothetical protein